MFTEPAVQTGAEQTRQMTQRRGMLARWVLQVLTIMALVSGFCGWPTAGSAGPLSTDAAQELTLSPSPVLPQLGPRYAPVTVEVSGVLGGSCPDALLRNLTRRLTPLYDVRLRFYPLRSSSERGEELLWTACDQKPEQCFAFLGELCAHPEWLASLGGSASLGSANPSDISPELWAAATRLGLDVADLQNSLRVHRYRRRLRSLWSGPLGSRLLPDVLVNGKRIVGAQLESRVFDEIDLQRQRAGEALREGAKVSTIFEQLSDPLREREDEKRRDTRWAPLVLGRFREPPRPPETVRVDVSGLPCQGPEIAAATLVYVFHHETFTAGAQARAVFDAWSRLRDRVRLCVLHAPITPSARRTSELIAQMAEVDTRLFFRVMEEIIDVMSRRYFLRYDEVAGLLRRRGELGKVEAASARGRIRVSADLDQLQRLGLRPGSFLVLGDRVITSWGGPDSLVQELTRATRTGLLAKLRSRTPR